MYIIFDYFVWICFCTYPRESRWRVEVGQVGVPQGYTLHPEVGSVGFFSQVHTIWVWSKIQFFIDVICEQPLRFFSYLNISFSTGFFTAKSHYFLPYNFHVSSSQMTIPDYINRKYKFQLDISLFIFWMQKTILYSWRKVFFPFTLWNLWINIACLIEFVCESQNSTAT